jgi:hypothetical protein
MIGAKKRKYYWYSYCYRNAGGSVTFSDDAIMIHPFEELKRLRKKGHRNTLLNWKEITLQEHESYHDEEIELK